MIAYLKMAEDIHARIAALETERDSLRTYAEAQRKALTLAACALIDADDTLRDQKLASAADRLSPAIDAVHVALAKNPAQPALGSLSSPQTGAQPERTETGPNTARPVPCAERDEMCWRRSCRALDTCVEREMREDDSRHQSGRDPLEAVRELLLDVQSLLDSKAYNLARDGVAGALMKVNEALRPQVGRNDELKTAATALYKWLLAVPHMDPPMARFSIPDEIWEPFQDALFDGAKP